MVSTTSSIKNKIMQKFKFKINGNTYQTVITETEDNKAEVEINGKKVIVEIEREDKTDPLAPKPPKPAPQTITKPVNTGVKNIKSPLPGTIVKVLVSNGKTVQRGDVLLTIESMKMENEVLAEKD